MSLQFILGSSGAGKSHYIYNKIIKESLENPDTNYILLVPEQYSLLLQRKMVMMHPNGGTLNIDVIGFNRLAYRVFDELNVKPKKVLQDFGKSMLIRQVAGKEKDNLKVFSGCLDKLGFIDEIKSLMSEMYQYNIKRDKLYDIIGSLDEKTDSLLYNKLKDMELIFSAFEEKMSDEYVVAEQITELLAEYIDQSELIKKSVIVMDGFTGFTPIQNNIIERLLINAKKVYTVFTIDEKNYYKQKLSEYELFYLTRQSIDGMKYLANKTNVAIEEDVLVGFGEEKVISRWDNEHSDLSHLERNLFRYPYEKYSNIPENIKITSYDNPRGELYGIADKIKKLVRNEGYRYKDIAVITGSLEQSSTYVEQVFQLFDIPFFIDSNQPVKNNPYVDSIDHAIKVVRDNFSYDSVFAFAKSGVMSEVTDEENELLENYVLARAIRGVSSWKKKWAEEIDDIRQVYMNVLLPFYDKIKPCKGGRKVSEYIDAIKQLMEDLSFEEKMAENIRLYGKLVEVLDKMTEIIGSENVEIDEFTELMKVGMKDISLGMIPGKLDMVVVGDITRSRLDGIKALFIMDMNDGIIPKKGANAQIISDSDKEILASYGMELAPTDKLNSYIQQFYLYINMTKPSHKLFLSYTYTSSGNDPMRPSYIIGRIKNIYPDIVCETGESAYVSTAKSSVDVLIEGMRELLSGNNEHFDETVALYKYYLDNDDFATIERIEKAFMYNNIPEDLSKDVTALIKARLLSQSVSRLESFARCAYNYFLQHTLGLRERHIYKLDNRNMGNVLHSTMEKLFRHVHDNLNNDWQSLSDEEIVEMTERFVEQSFNEEYYGSEEELDIIKELDGRYLYLKNMLIRIGRRTAGALRKMMSEDVLEPTYFEHRFSKSYVDESGNTLMNINGVVDRGDVHYSKEENKLYLRIIDYKSGDHDFKISKLYEGLQLQLSLYMGIMMDLVKGYSASDNKDIEIVPEGMYYYHMHDPFIEIGDSKDLEKLETLRSKELKLKGCYGEDDALYFKNIIKFADYKATEIAKNITDGIISKNPFWESSYSACEYCSYKDVCRFDEKSGNNRYRYQKYTEKDRDKIYEEILKALEEV